MNDFGRGTSKSHGYVNWPETGWGSTGEGGMSVYAVWRENTNEICAPYLNCMFNAVIMEDFEQNRKIKRVINGNTLPDFEKCARVKGIVYLGSTGLSLWNGHQYFEATRDDLTHSGKTLIGKFDKHYGSEAEIITCLDT